MSLDREKEAAARKALEFVESGMRLGLGTGSTAESFVRLLGQKVADGLKVVGVPTSERTREVMEELSIPVTHLGETPRLDLTVDGADEFDGDLNLIKGGGGALLREKIVAAASKRMVVIADHTKKVDVLGEFPLAIEVVPFGAEATALHIAEIARAHGSGGAIERRADEFGEPFLTDSNNFIYDCHFRRIADASGLCRDLNLVPGVVDNGLFIDMADVVIVATGDRIDLLERRR